MLRNAAISGSARVSVRELPPQLDQRLLRQACGRFPTGVAIATRTLNDGSPWGVTVSSFTSVSLNPPLVLICLARRSTFLQDLTIGHPFAINVLSDQVPHLVSTFSSGGPDRFAGVSYALDDAGSPTLERASSVLSCNLDSIVDKGDHAILIGAVRSVTVGNDEPLLYCHSRLWTFASSRSEILR